MPSTHNIQSMHLSHKALHKFARWLYGRLSERQFLPCKITIKMSRLVRENRKRHTRKIKRKIAARVGKTRQFFTACSSSINFFIVSNFSYIMQQRTRDIPDFRKTVEFLTKTGISSRNFVEILSSRGNVWFFFRSRIDHWNRFNHWI